MEMMLEVSSCEGELFGHLLDKENNMPMYKRLEKEKVLRLLWKLYIQDIYDQQQITSRNTNVIKLSQKITMVGH